MEEVRKLLAECLDDLDRGNSVEECLARYPERREELEPLLHAAQRVRSAPRVAPSEPFREGARERMVRQIRYRQSVQEHRSEPKRLSFWAGLWSRLRASMTVRRFALPVAAAVTVLLVLSMLGVGAVYASAQSLPGDSLYRVKLAGERVRLALSLSESREAKLHLRFASERLKEAAALVERNRGEDIEPLMREYAEEVEAASGGFQRHRTGGRDVTSLSRVLQHQLAQQERRLSRVRQTASEEARLAVEQALAASRAAQQQIREQHESPEASATSEPTGKPSATGTARPTETRKPTDTAEPGERTGPTVTRTPPRQTRSPEAPVQTATSPSGEGAPTSPPPGQTGTPQPPGLTNTPQPPGQSKTPQPPEETARPQPPEDTPVPPPEETPGPPTDDRPGPQPPGLTKTPQPPGRTRTPGKP